MKLLTTFISFILFTLLFAGMFAFISEATELKGGRKVIYKYKKYEKFDFEDLSIAGESGGPGDLSVLARHQKKFSNRLPYRNNFNFEIRKAIERIR
jgi:hypothetical protein